MQTAITEVLEILNQDSKNMYSLAYCPVQKSWKVYKLLLLDKQRDLYRAMPFSQSHVSAQAALKDALILSAHYARVEATATA